MRGRGGVRKPKLIGSSQAMLAWIWHGDPATDALQQAIAGGWKFPKFALLGESGSWISAEGIGAVPDPLLRCKRSTQP